MSTRGKLFGWTMGAIITAAAVSAINTNQYSLQQALNILAGNSSAPFTHFSTQQAANMMVATIPAQRDSLVGMICIVYEDCMKAQWDSVRVLNPTRGGPGTAGGRTWDFPAGVSVD